MLCSIGDYYLADGTLSGGFTLTGLRLKMDRIFDSVILVPQVLKFGKLITGMVYKIINYRSPDDFTNVGGTNVTGDVFVATGTTPTSWTNESTLIAIGPGMFDRNKRRVEISFTVQRVQASIKAADNFINEHELTVPRTGDIKLIVSTYSVPPVSPISPVALIVNGELLSHELIRQIGSFTEHSYQIVGSPIFSPIPDTDHLVTEGGDRITTEGGDSIVVE